MLVLVTGGAGFLGSALVERLIARGQKRIRCLVRPSSNLNRLEAIRNRWPEAQIEYAYGDLAHASTAGRALKDVDTVYHLAAGMQGAYADMVLNSVVASRNLLDGVLAKEVPNVVLTSSFAVYGVADMPRGALLNEDSPLEKYPEKRDPYSFAKLKQELLFHEYQKRGGFQLVVLRPGVIYGPGGGGMSARVGLQLPGFVLRCGGGNLLPLSYVDNCANAIAIAGTAEHQSLDEVYNVHDDDLPTCGRYFRQYSKHVSRARSVRIPYTGALALSKLFEWYHVRSRGQLPAFLTPYKAACLWKGNRFDNSKLKKLGWTQLVPIDEGLQRTFTYLRELNRSVRA